MMTAPKSETSGATADITIPEPIEEEETTTEVTIQDEAYSTTEDVTETTTVATVTIMGTTIHK